MVPMDARELRVSDAEREYVGQLLQRAVGQGMLSLGEFTERMDTVLSAKTRGDLNVVLADLPGIRLRSEAAEAAEPEQPRHDVIRGQFSSVNRKGAWRVPAKLRVSTKFSGVTLDFTQAVLTSRVVEIELDDYCSGVTLIVPPLGTVDVNGIELVAASVNNKVRSGPPAGTVHVVVRGRIRFGSVTAKHPFGTGLRKLMGQV